MDLKSFKNQNKIIFSMEKKSGSHCGTKNIKNIKSKASRKRSYYSINSSIIDSCSDYYLSSDIEWEELIQPTERREINNLYHIVTNNDEVKSVIGYKMIIYHDLIVKLGLFQVLQWDSATVTMK